MQAWSTILAQGGDEGISNPGIGLKQQSSAIIASSGFWCLTQPTIS